MLIEKVEGRTAVIGVIGLGYVGLPLAVEKAKAGFTECVPAISNRPQPLGRDFNKAHKGCAGLYASSILNKGNSARNGEKISKRYILMMLNIKPIRYYRARKVDS